MKTNEELVMIKLVAIIVMIDRILIPQPQHSQTIFERSCVMWREIFLGLFSKTHHFRLVELVKLVITKLKSGLSSWIGVLPLACIKALPLVIIDRRYIRKKLSLDSSLFRFNKSSGNTNFPHCKQKQPEGEAFFYFATQQLQIDSKQQK